MNVFGNTSYCPGGVNSVFYLSVSYAPDYTYGVWCLGVDQVPGYYVVVTNCSNPQTNFSAYAALQWTTGINGTIQSYVDGNCIGNDGKNNLVTNYVCSIAPNVIENYNPSFQPGTFSIGGLCITVDTPQVSYVTLTACSSRNSLAQTLLPICAPAPPKNTEKVSSNSQKTLPKLKTNGFNTSFTGIPGDNPK